MITTVGYSSWFVWVLKELILKGFVNASLSLIPEGVCLSMYYPDWFCP
jgi:hypothetical protein